MVEAAQWLGQLDGWGSSMVEAARWLRQLNG